MTKAEKMIREPFVLEVDLNKNTYFNIDRENKVYDFTNNQTN